MIQDVVIVLLADLSPRDIDHITDLHPPDRPVRYHLLVPGDPATAGGNTSALLGIDDADTFGSPARALRRGGSSG